MIGIHIYIFIGFFVNLIGFRRLDLDDDAADAVLIGMFFLLMWAVWPFWIAAVIFYLIGRGVQRLT
jgi:hypothetical protein